MVADAGDSFLGAVGGLIPVLRPLGFGTWQAAVALLSGLVAKEAVVSSVSMFVASPGTAARPSPGRCQAPSSRGRRFWSLYCSMSPCGGSSHHSQGR